MSTGMTKVLHVKLPVTDLQRTIHWYAALLGLRLTHEFIEQDEVRGVAMRSDEAGFSLAFRLREHCMGKPDLSGFDIVSLHMTDRDALVRLRDTCARLGVDCSPVQDRGPHEAIVDVPDPDGTVLRFYWVDESVESPDFLGMIFEGDGPPRFVAEPRLQPPHSGS